MIDKARTIGKARRIHGDETHATQNENAKRERAVKTFEQRHQTRQGAGLVDDGGHKR
jgi:hypothetical protein